MQTSNEIDKIAPSLLKAQKMIRFAAKDAKNPHFRNDYATLESVIDAVKDALNNNGIMFMQTPSPSDDGRLHLTTRLIHESGQWVQDTAVVSLQKQDAQGFGSAMTYLRRYSLSAITGLYQADDDGQEASKPAPKAAVKPMDDGEVDACKWAMLECDGLEALKSIFAAAYKRANEDQQKQLKAAYDSAKTNLTKEAA